MIDNNINQNTLEEIAKKYPWINFYSSDRAQYIPPKYYNKLLKDYSFYNKTDLNYLKQFLTQFQNKKNLSILELGCGSGRCTDTALKYLSKYKKYVLTDLSEDMLNFVKNKFKNSNLRYEQADHLDFLSQCTDQFDIIYCLWSFSHSVHQHIEKHGKKETFKKLNSALNNLINNMLSEKGKMFLIHFDTCSEEQSILVKQWGKNFKEFDLNGNQSFSKKYIDKILFNLTDNTNINVSVKHLLGDAIEYNSLDQAMEIFMNFHMETEYNRSEKLPSVVKELETDLSKYSKNDKIFIRPGCFIYEIEKV